MYHPAFSGFQGLRSFQPETLSYRSRAGSLSIGAQIAIDAFILRGKTVGWWADHTAIYLFATSTAGAAVLNLKGTSFTGTLNGTAGTNYNFVPYQGIKFDGTAGWFNPNLPWASIVGGSYSQHGMWAYTVQDQSLTTSALGASSGGSEIAIRPRNGKNAQFFDGSTTSFSVANSAAVGFFGLFRNNASTFIANIKGAEVTETLTISAYPATAPAVGRLGINGATYDASNVGMIGFLGGSTTLNSAAMRADLQAACDALMLAIGAVSQTTLFPQPDPVLPSVFGPTTINSVVPAGIRVFQNSPPPADTDTAATFSLFPGSDYATTQINTLVASTATKVFGHALQWAPRANVKSSLGANNCFPPIYTGEGQQCGMEFSTIARAIAAQDAVTRWLVGMVAHAADGVSGYLDVLNAAGMPDSAWIPYATAQASPSTYFTRAPTNGGAQIVCLDMVVTPNAQLSTAPQANMRKGILLDYEVADTRTAAQTQQACTNFANVCTAAGYESTLYLDQLNGGNAQNEGIAGAIAALMPLFTRACIMIWPGNPEKNIATCISDQMAMIPKQYWPKVSPIIGVGPTGGQLALSDCQTIATAIATYGWQSLIWWRDNAVVGTETYNNILETVMGLPLT